MLKVLFAIACVAAALYLIVWIVLPMLAAIAAALWDIAARRKGAAQVPEAAVPDDAEFARLAREAMAFSTRPDVTVVAWAETLPYETILHREAADVFCRKTYVETQRRIGKELHTVLCAYEDGKRVASACHETPVSQVRWDAYFAGLEDLRTGGAFVSFTDERGRRRETRLPGGRRHHA